MSPFGFQSRQGFGDNISPSPAAKTGIPIGAANRVKIRTPPVMKIGKPIRILLIDGRSGHGWLLTLATSSSRDVNRGDGMEGMAVTLAAVDAIAVSQIGGVIRLRGRWLSGPPKGSR